MDLHKTDTATHPYDEGDGSFGYLVETASDLDLPDGLSAEVIGRNIIVSPWSKGYYHKGMRSLMRQLDPHVPEGHEAHASPLLFVFPDHGAFGPDIWVADADMVDIDSNKIPGEALSLVAELTSPATRHFDRHQKVDVYGSAIPVYLLFDMKEHVLTVYSDPSMRGYRQQISVDFGEPVHIPAPFDFELDTTAFKRKQV